MRPLHVDLISEHASPLAALGGEDAGGQNVAVGSLATELGRLGCTVRVFTRRDSVELADRVPLSSEVTVEHIDAGPVASLPKDELFGYMPTFAERLQRRWMTEPPDVAHAHFWMSGWAAARAAMRVSSIPLVQSFHALGTVKRRHQGAADTSPPARQAVESSLVNYADHILASCHDEVRELLAIGAEQDRITVVPCGVDPVLFRPDGAVVPPGTTEHRVVMVTRLVRRKGVEDAIRALPDVPDTELLVAGGPDARSIDDDPEVRRLTRISRRLGVADRVQFLGGIPREEVPALLRSADVLVSVPWYEPFGIVPLEAMACGVPVVGTAVGGLLDTVRHRRTGLLVPTRSPEAIAQAVNDLLANPSLRHQMGLEAAARVRDRFTWSQVAWSTLDVYQRAQRGAWWAVPA